MKRLGKHRRRSPVCRCPRWGGHPPGKAGLARFFGDLMFSIMPPFQLWHNRSLHLFFMKRFILAHFMQRHGSPSLALLVFAILTRFLFILHLFGFGLGRFGMFAARFASSSPDSSSPSLSSLELMLRFFTTFGLYANFTSVPFGLWSSAKWLSVFLQQQNGIP